MKSERQSVLDDLPEGLFTLAGNSPAELLVELGSLREMAGGSTARAARRWWQARPRFPHPLGLAFVAATPADLQQQMAAAVAHLRERPETLIADRFYYSPTPLRGEIAFVYPGSGNHFPDMGRDLGVAFPQVLRRQMAENRRLRSQYHASDVWGADRLDGLSPRDLIFAQVSLGTLVSDLLGLFRVAPRAVVGYSLGESAGMYGTRAWRDRDEMFQRMLDSSLFTTDLAGPCDSARRQWGLAAGERVDWLTGVVSVSAERIRNATSPGMRAYVLIVNTADDCVIGGRREDVEEVVRRVGATFLEVHGVTTAHCEVAEPVKGPYRELHYLPTYPPPGVRYYSGASGRSYKLDAGSAADAITAAVLGPVDFPTVVTAAYNDGARIFIEIGPGASCTRMIGSILAGKPHLARAVCVPRQDGVSMVLKLLANLHAEGVAVDLGVLYSGPEAAETAAGPTLAIPVGYHPKRVAAPANGERPVAVALPEKSVASSLPVAYAPHLLGRGPAVAMADAQSAIVQAHAAYLRFSTAAQGAVAQSLAWQTETLQRIMRSDDEWPAPTFSIPFVATDEVPRALDYEQCCEFARGLAGHVLGAQFAEVDTFPTRVRLPDGPLQLVDRIVSIEGEPKSLTSGRVVTEHHVHDGRWYLDAGRIPTCVAVEAGQADLFLSGYLGIDFKTRGLACYRLLDASVTFHRLLPAIGDTIRYDIRIDNFFRQGETYLFRFRFESTVNGEPLLSMADGCAGFFTAADLAAGKGIVHTSFDTKPTPGMVPDGWAPAVPLREQSLTATQVDALRAGDLVAAFGPDFARANLKSPMRLPGGMLRLVHRIEAIEPNAGRYGLGRIRGEADIHPDDWFLTCHFVDDQVMPGTLMYECCMHTLRVLLMRMGWVCEEGEAVCEPVPGVTSRLKCRGQVTATTSKVTYEVALKEIGFRPEPYVLCDALMYADGKPIVEITHMSLRMSGLTRERIDEIWAGPSRAQKRVLFDTDSILAFAVGKPSEAFGERYRVFDSERVIARLPGPPYQFLDRITRIDHCKPWELTAGGVIDAEYDVPADAWYFAGNRCDNMPFSILLEIALQPCGWLAAYLGSALTSPTDLSFRNLGGSATQFAEVHPDAGTLTTTVKITRVSSSGGMIIQHYDYDVRQAGRPVYAGNTYFGFFSKDALANQVGLKDAALLTPGPAERAGWHGALPSAPPFPDPMLRMVDDITWSTETEGLNGWGSVEGRVRVDPEAWFFRAHFHQDPVWPGSLGLESLVQLMKLYAQRRWGNPPAGWQAVALNRPHRWVYRGQILPTDSAVTVQAYITSVDDAARVVTADGLLSVDGRLIYQMWDFTIQG